MSSGTEHDHGVGRGGNESPDSKGQTAAASVEASRRRFERTKINTQVQVYLAKGSERIDTPIDCIAVDIGRGGMCLRSRRPMIAGSFAFVRLPLAQKKWKLLFGEIMHTEYADSGMYHMGMQFAPIPSTSEYQEWIESLTRKFGGGDC